MALLLRVLFTFKFVYDTAVHKRVGIKNIIMKFKGI